MSERHTRKCSFCKEDFNPSFYNQKYCDKTCKEKARYQRRKKNPKWVKKVRAFQKSRRGKIRTLKNPKFEAKLTSSFRKFRIEEDVVNLHLIGDFHFGNPNCSVTGLKKAKKFIKTSKKSYVIGMGDYFELSTLKQNYSIFLQKAVENQWDFLVEYFRDIPNILGLLCGNHERRVRMSTGLPLDVVFSENLEIQNFGYRQLIALIIGRRKSVKTYLLDLRHGCTFARTAGGKLNAVKRSPIEGVDVVASGHTHDLNFRQEPYREATLNGLKWKTRYFIQTGGFLKYQESYAEERDLEPTPIGHAMLRFAPDKVEVKCLNWQDYE